MILVDTSAWVDYLRGSGSTTHLELRRLVTTEEVAITEPVVMEVLAGARDVRHLEQLRGLLARSAMVPCVGEDYAEAAFLYRLCRANGVAPRSQLDCLIAAVAIRNDLAVLHHDRDFDGIVRHTPLEVHPS